MATERERTTGSETTYREVNVDRADVDRDANPDPITGAPGAHPVGTGLGAAAGGHGLAGLL